MTDLNTNLSGGNVNTGTSWQPGSLEGATDGLFGVAGPGGTYSDQISQSGNPYSDATASPSNYFVYNTPEGVPILYPPSAEENPLMNNPLNDLIPTEMMSENFDSFLSASSDQSNAPRYANITVTDPEILAYAQTNGQSPGYVQTNVTMTQAYLFNQQLANLPESTAKQLQFAFYANASEDLTPALKTLYDGIMANVATGIQEDFGFTSAWEPINTTSKTYTEAISREYDINVENGLDELVNSGVITQEEAESLRTAHYDPSTNISDRLKALLTDIQAQTTQALQAKYGFSTNWQPVPDTATYMLTCNGDFAINYQRLCNDYIGDDISEADKALLETYFANPNDPSVPQRIKDMAAELTQTRTQLLKYFDNPNDPSIPENIKTIGRELVTQATNATIAKYNLSSDWQPTITSLVAPGVDIISLNRATNALNAMNEILETAETRVNQMPDGPDKAVYLNFLKQIGQAILDLQEAIGLMQVAKTDTAKAAANAKLNSALDNYELQKAAADEVKDKQDKMGGAGWLSDMTNWMTNLTVLLLAACMGPVALVIAILYTIDKEYANETGKTSLVQQMFTIISDACEKLGAQGTWLSSALNLTIATVISVASCNVFLAINLYTEDSGFVEDFVAGCGGDEMAQMICSMVFTMCVQIFMVVFMFICTGGVGATASVANIITKIMQVANVSMKAASRILNAASAAIQLLMASLQVAASGITLNNNVLLAQIDIIKGRADSRSEEIDAMIQLLQKLITKLLEMLNGDTSWYTSLSNFNGKKWGDASSVLTHLMG